VRRLTVDVAVVGAGPAGSAAAFHLARAGLRVALVDRARFPRAKVCGDGLTPCALAEIEALDAMRDLGPLARLDTVTATDLVGGHTWRGAPPSVSERQSWAAVVPRVVLDDALRRAAERAGATLVAGADVRTVVRGRRRSALAALGDGRSGVVATTSDGDLFITADVIVAADGSTGRIARLLAPDRPSRPTGLAVRRYVRLDGPLEPALRIYVPLVAGGVPVCGYGWVFPVGPRLANVGVGCLAGEGRMGAPLRRVFAGFLAALRRVEPWAATAEPDGPLEGGTIRVGARPRDLVIGDALLAGDAGGLANPITGEGIGPALRSGRAAAAAIVEHLGAGRALASAYPARLEAELPQPAALADHLGWLAERGGVRARELCELIAGSRLVGRAVRRVAFAELGGTTPASAAHPPPPRPERDARSGPERLARRWTRAARVLAHRHPLLARLLEAVRGEAAAAADAAFDGCLEQVRHAGRRRAGRRAGEDTTHTDHDAQGAGRGPAPSLRGGARGLPSAARSRTSTGHRGGEDAAADARGGRRFRSSGGLGIPLAHLALTALLVDDLERAVGPVPPRRADRGPRPSDRGRWAADAVTLAAIDVLVAETFRALAALPAAEASIFAERALALSERRLRREVACPRTRVRAAPRKDLDAVAAR
jgi:geranylgeranyl reductase family protein